MRPLLTWIGTVFVGDGKAGNQRKKKETNDSPVIAGNFDDVVCAQTGDGSGSFRRVMTLEEGSKCFTGQANECNLVTTRTTRAADGGDVDG